MPGRKARAIAIKKADPAVTPIMEGSANGFLVIPCIIAPDTARAAPTHTAAMARGNLNSLMMT